MSAPTPGPWTWIGDARHGGFCLATVGRGHQYVMDFVRMGMSGAQPRFQVREDGNGLMVPARDLCTFQVGAPSVIGYEAAKADRSVYRYQIDDIDHPDARLIKAAPRLLAALTRVMEMERPLTGNPTHAQLVEHWLHEQAQGNERAGAMLDALDAIAGCGK